MNLLAMIEQIDELKREYALTTDYTRLSWLEKEIAAIERQMKEEQSKEINKPITGEVEYWRVFYKVQELLLTVKRFKHNDNGSPLPDLTAECNRITDIVLGKAQPTTSIPDYSYLATTYALTKHSDHPAMFYVEDDDEYMIDMDEFIELLVEAGDENEIAKYIELESQGVTDVLLVRGW